MLDFLLDSRGLGSDICRDLGRIVILSILETNFIFLFQVHLGPVSAIRIAIIILENMYIVNIILKQQQFCHENAAYQ